MVNLGIVMLLGGLWHGAKWNFVLWGAYHGAWLAIERWRGKRSLYEFFPRPARIAITFLLMLFSWVLFRADDLGAAWDYYGAMFALTPAADTAPLLAASLYSPYRLLILVVCAILVFQPLQAHDWAIRPVTWARVAVLVPLLVLSVATMYAQAFNPFLYFQF
jgi:alginate O-acetyltransferase complex protein AlgI